MRDLSKIDKNALHFVCALADVYRDDEDRELHAFDKLVTGDDITEDFTSMLVAMSILFDRVSGFDGDLIDFTHILNKLAVQYILEHQEVTDEETQSST